MDFGTGIGQHDRWNHALSTSKYYRAIPKHKQLQDKWCVEQAHNDTLVLWQRLWMLAISRAAPNGHAGFPGDDLAEILGARPGGTVKKIHRQKVWEALDKLKTMGWIDPSSDRHCVVLPADGFSTGLKGKDKPCSYHTGESPSVSTDLIVVDREAMDLCRETNRAVRNLQAREILRPELRDEMSRETGRGFQPYEGATA